MYINTAEQISGILGIPLTYDLTIGASGQKARASGTARYNCLCRYTAIPRLVADGVYGENTQASVRAFQKIF